MGAAHARVFLHTLDLRSTVIAVLELRGEGLARIVVVVRAVVGVLVQVHEDQVTFRLSSSSSAILSFYFVPDLAYNDEKQP